MWQAALPLAVATTGSLASGALAGVGLILMADGTNSQQLLTPDVASMGLVLAFGLATGVASALVTRPMLAAATASGTA